MDDTTQPFPPKSTRSLRWRLLSLSVGILVIVSLVAAGSVFLFIYQNEQMSWLGRQQEAANRAGDNVAYSVENAINSLRFVGSLKPEDLQENKSVLGQLLQHTPSLLEVVRFDASGQVIASAYKETPLLTTQFTVPQSSWFLKAQVGESYMGGVQILASYEPYLIMAVPAAYEGVVAARLGLQELWNVTSGIRFGDDGVAYVVDQDGQIVAHQDPNLVLTLTSIRGRPEMQALTRAPNHEWHGVYKNFQGAKVVGVTVPVPGTDWVVITESPQSEAYATTRTALVVLGGGMLFLVIVAGMLIGRSIRSLILVPLEMVGAGAERIGQGDLSHRIAVRRDDEIGQLAHALNRMTGELQDLHGQLSTRGRELERRARYLEATATIARDAALQLNLRKLLSEVALRISRQVGFYHTGIYLLDPTGKWVVLQAASSERGQQLLARGYRLQIGTGLVGQVAEQGRPRVALDIAADADLIDHVDLPSTRSEMALPLRARDEIIGVLDVHSDETEAFTDEDVSVLQALADLVAVAISNARLMQQAKDSLGAERRAYGELSRKAWRDLLRGRRDLNIVRNERGLFPTDEMLPLDAMKAIAIGQSVPEAVTARNRLTPIQVRGQVIGVIEAQKPENGGEWTPAQIALLNALAEQLGETLEAARLFQNTVQRAARDRLLGDVAARMRETLDIDTVVQTAVREIGMSMGLAAVDVRLGTEPPSDGDAF